MEVIKKDEYGIPEICKKCGHYSDCPEFYECPPMSIVKDIEFIFNHHQKDKE